MCSEEILEQLQFSREWLELGIVTPASLAELWREYETGEDSNLEHYRWRAFASFLRGQKIMSAPLHRALYHLGERDPDAPMGQAMRFELLRRADCPLDLLETAANAREKALVRFANKLLLARRIPQAA